MQASMAHVFSLLTASPPDNYVYRYFLADA
jgi:hypothetical protein